MTLVARLFLVALKGCRQMPTAVEWRIFVSRHVVVGLLLLPMFAILLVGVELQI